MIPLIPLTETLNTLSPAVAESANTSLSGSVADAKPNIGQKLGDMLNMLGGMQGSLAEALDFENIKGNLFPFETPPNKAVSDFYTLARGGAGQPDTQKPSASAIQKAVSKVKNVAPSIPEIPFAEPTKNMPNINLASKKILGGVGEKGGILKDAAKELKKVKSKIDSGLA